MQRHRILYYMLGLLATQFILVGSLVVPAQSDICNPSLQLCLNRTITDEFRTIQVIDLDRRAGGGGGKGGKGKDPEPVPGSGSSGGGDTPSTPGGSTGNGGFETEETAGGFETAETEGGFGQPTPDKEPEPVPPAAPAPDTEPQPGRSNPADDERVVVVQDSRALATLERWKCGKTKRTSLFHRLSRRAFTSADATDPEKYLEWLENMATDDNKNRFPRDKLVFFTTFYNKGTKIIANKFIEANPG
ncbi:hypothetical protein P171DRAFT_478181 [Karstenula rhodostoma CBS 690.94]|uniref:Uncharacterized protein n=1 Tax=Karstenula rhodostoma CBS 690.94 TaxID=1392251 RepID=A0A9P4U500_9PLEO|nr:hypothetical protein P171DRAFT_478181 [Karstenula rhodostoma CBS 690.94]